MEAAHHQEGARRLGSDLGGRIGAVAEGDPVEGPDDAVEGDPGSHPDAEPVDPVGRAEERGQVGKVEPDVELAAEHGGRVGSGLVHGADGEETANPLGPRPQANGVADLETERLGQTLLDRDARRAREGRPDRCLGGEDESKGEHEAGGKVRGWRPARLAGTPSRG